MIWPDVTPVFVVVLFPTTASVFCMIGSSVTDWIEPSRFDKTVWEPVSIEKLVELLFMKAKVAVRLGVDSVAEASCEAEILFRGTERPPILRGRPLVISELFVPVVADGLSLTRTNVKLSSISGKSWSTFARKSSIS